MVQRCQRARLALESTYPFRICREGVREYLDGHRASELGVLRAVHLSHPTRAEQRLDSKGPELMSHERRGCEEAFRCSFLREQRFDLLAQRQVAGTLLVQKRSSFGRVLRQRSVKQPLDLPPAFRCHRVSVTRQFIPQPGRSSRFPRLTRIP